MTLEIIGASVLWLFLFGYVIVASIDFGAGFYHAYSLLTNREDVLVNVIQRYLSPVWEVTNVFLVFFFVGIVGFFPKTAFYYGTILLIPASISIVLLAIRGSYYAFASYSKKSYQRYTIIYGLAGLFIPASLSVVLTISEGGFVSIVDGNPVLDYWALFSSPLSWSIVLLSLTSELYISAVFLTWYANKAGDRSATDLLRKFALIVAAPAIITAGGIIVELSVHNEEHYKRILDLWWMFGVSLLLFIGTVWLIWKRQHYGTAFSLLVGQFAFAFFGYGIAHYPYLLYPFLTMHEGFTNEAMAIALIVAFIAGLCLLVPSLWLLLKLFLFNRDYVQGKKL